MAEIIIFFSLLLVGYVVGQIVEQRHYRSIIKREKQLREMPIIASKKLPEEFIPCSTQLIYGNVVISVDFFKKFVAGLRMLAGGRVGSYESLIDRGRREALLRMREEAFALRASYVFNVKMETSSISKGYRDSIGSIEVLAYGTAVIPEDTGRTVETETPGVLNLKPA